MKRKIVILTFAFFLIYVSDYIVVRQLNLKIISDADGCPASGCVYVSFPFEGFNLLYSPLIVIDKNLTGAHFYIIEK